MPPHWLLLSLLSPALQSPATAATPPAQGPAQASRPQPAVQPPAFRACLAELRPRMLDAGIGTAVFDRHVASLAPDPAVLELLDHQPEFTVPIWDYLAPLVDAERVADGKAMLDRHSTLLDRIEATYGVDRHLLVALWGIETDYGRTPGTRPLLASLATLSCAGRRQSFFRAELRHALRIVQAGDMAAGDLVGSWAGAFGHTQFMPSTYQRVAVDFDGDGRRDLAGSIPDALASSANYLRRAGWHPGEPWGLEVRLPDGFGASVSGLDAKRPLDYWTRRNVQRADGSGLALPGSIPASLWQPAGADGPVLLVLPNFHAILRYNPSSSYALAIALLSDRLRGAPPLRTPWPTDDPGLAREQRRELQRLLLARGHPIGEVDGIVGSRTRAAILDEQRRLGLEPTGRASERILQALRGSSLPPSP